MPWCPVWPGKMETFASSWAAIETMASSSPKASWHPSRPARFPLFLPSTSTTHRLLGLSWFGGSWSIVSLHVSKTEICLLQMWMNPRSHSSKPYCARKRIWFHWAVVSVTISFLSKQRMCMYVYWCRLQSRGLTYSACWAQNKLCPQIYEHKNKYETR